MMKSEVLASIWTVYDHPRDMPEFYVARRWEVIRDFDGPFATADILKSERLDEIREQMEQRGLVRIWRQDGDDPRIIESWI